VLITTPACIVVHGHVGPGFETVREAFADNFARRRELGGACSTYRRGEKVVDLCGGIRNKATGEAWEQDTMVIVYSATKGLAAMTLALAQLPEEIPNSRLATTALEGDREWPLQLIDTHISVVFLANDRAS
jgi:CubicO group peptidase (beta-lactamase class C family)